MKMSNKTYDVLHDIAQIVLPALATLYTTLADIWSLPLATAIPATIMAVDLFLGAMLKDSNNKYKASLYGSAGEEDSHAEN